MFFDFWRPSGPKSDIWLCFYTRLGNTRILRLFWRKSVEKQKCLCIFMAKNVKKKSGVFRVFTAPCHHKKIIGLEVTCSLLIHAFWAIFEVNQLRNTSVIGEKPSKTSKIGCFSNFYGPLTPPKSYRPRIYMQLVNTRILRHFWSKSVEKHQCYSRKTLKNVKNGVFLEIIRPPDTPKKLSASKLRAASKYTHFAPFLK